MLEQLKSPAFRTALIGLLGTMLTVCGGLGGALVTSAARGQCPPEALTPCKDSARLSLGQQ